MDKKPRYLLVDTAVLPEVFSKVVEVKELINTGKCKTAQEASKFVNISRSSFYKYKDYIFPFYEMGKEKIITLLLDLVDNAGILSNVLNVFAKAQLDVLTINQNIPINGIANITISLRTSNMEMGIDVIIDELEKMEEVKKVKLLARE